MNGTRPVDISELYDLFRERKDCYFVCCDIQYMIRINEIAYKAGDLAISEVVRRMEVSSGTEDYIFRIGGDEFVLLTGSRDAAYAEHIADHIRGMNGETFSYEDQQIPLSLHVSVTKVNYESSVLRYEELFSSLHQAIQSNKQ